MPDLLGIRSRATDLPSAMLSVAVLDWQTVQAEATISAVTGFGAYDGVPAQVALLPDGRQARLLAPISYRQADNTTWPVPAGASLDGASIPRVFWTLIGGPFEGLYRDASIVHDYYCDAKNRAWRAVHRMFYEAMRCSGVGEVKAKVMYYAVYRFGPRWPDGGIAAEALIVAPRAPHDADAASIEADAEAIAMHGLDLDEIDNLADARAAQPQAAPAAPAALGGLEAPGAAALARVRLLVITGGQGTTEDVDAVAQAAAQLPAFVVSHFENKRIRIVACREGITDFERSLRGQTPRGWEGTGRTWDDVPGTYLERVKRVVIATIDQGAGREVPTQATLRHGSANLVVHESLHGYDYSTNHTVLGERRFTSARQNDLPRLRTYELQPGRAGLEETYAESGARFVFEPATMQGDWPNLFNYWSQQPGAAPLELPLAAPAVAAEAAEAPEAPEGGALGTAELLDNGTIELDLRAEGPGGVIGHAVLRVASTEPQYQALRQHLFGATTAAVPAPAALGSRKVPYRPKGN